IVADVLVNCPEAGPAARFQLAAVYAIAAASLVHDARYPSVERSRLSEEYAARAMELLSASAGKGGLTASQQQILRDASDFQALRARADFDQLLLSKGGVASKDAR